MVWAWLKHSAAAAMEKAGNSRRQCLGFVHGFLHHTPLLPVTVVRIQQRRHILTGIGVNMGTIGDPAHHPDGMRPDMTAQGCFGAAYRNLRVTYLFVELTTRSLAASAASGVRLLHRCRSLEPIHARNPPALATPTRYAPRENITA